MVSPLRVNTTELLRRPGDHRDVAVDVTVESLAIVDERIDSTAPVDVRVRLDALNGGVAVSGIIGFDWRGTCRRCAVEIHGHVDADVDERYQERVTDPDAFEFDGIQLDLQPMVREVVLLELPSTPLCTPDCQGLCPVCGTDRNTSTCTCEAAPADPRWAALDQLRDV